MFKTLRVTQRLVSFSNAPTVLWLPSLAVTVAFWHLTRFWGGSLNTSEGAKSRRAAILGAQPSTGGRCLKRRDLEAHLLAAWAATVISVGTSWIGYHLQNPPEISVDRQVGSTIWTLCYRDRSVLIAHSPSKTPGAHRHILQPCFLDAKHL